MKRPSSSNLSDKIPVSSSNSLLIQETLSSPLSADPPAVA